jgi:hypothetical protein
MPSSFSASPSRVENVARNYGLSWAKGERRNLKSNALRPDEYFSGPDVETRVLGSSTTNRVAEDGFSNRLGNDPYDSVQYGPPKRTAKQRSRDGGFFRSAEGLGREMDSLAPMAHSSSLQDEIGEVTSEWVRADGANKKGDGRRIEDLQQNIEQLIDRYHFLHVSSRSVIRAVACVHKI